MTYSNLEGYLAGYTLDTTVGINTAGYIKNIRLAVYVPTGEDVTVTAKLNGIVGTEYNKAITITLVKIGTYNTYDVYATPINSLSIYNMTEVVTLTVTKSDSSTVSGTYSLAEYVYNNQSVNVVKALYTLAEAAKAYKLEEIAQ